jgi:hypothetical protein
MQLGEYIAKQWKFPARLVHTIRYHHTPGQAPSHLSKNDKLLLAIVHLADGLSMMMGAGVGADGLMYPLDSTYLNRCGIATDAKAIEALIGFTMGLESEIKLLYDSIKQQ